MWHDLVGVEIALTFRTPPAWEAVANCAWLEKRLHAGVALSHWRSIRESKPLWRAELDRQKDRYAQLRTVIVAYRVCVECGTAFGVNKFQQKRNVRRCGACSARFNASKPKKYPTHDTVGHGVGASLQCDNSTTGNRSQS